MNGWRKRRPLWIPMPICWTPKRQRSVYRSGCLCRSLGRSSCSFLPFSSLPNLSRFSTTSSFLRVCELTTETKIDRLPVLWRCFDWSFPDLPLILPWSVPDFRMILASSFPDLCLVFAWSLSDLALIFALSLFYLCLIFASSRLRSFDSTMWAKILTLKENSASTT